MEKKLEGRGDQEQDTDIIQETIRKKYEQKQEDIDKQIQNKNKQGQGQKA